MGWALEMDGDVFLVGQIPGNVFFSVGHGSLEDYTHGHVFFVCR